MARVVGVHGVGKQLLGEESLLKDWRPALRDGLRRFGGPELARGDLAMGFYGDLFRPQGQTLAVGDALYGAADVEDGFEQDLLFTWWRAAAAVDEGVVPPDGDTLARTPRSVQAALRALSRSRFFSGLALRALVFDLKQTRRYLLEPGLRQAARDRVSTAIGDDTRVVVAHSLGSVVAYEALCALDGHGVRALVTLGSPLGLRMVFDRLQPVPSPTGAWPGGGALVWTNLADHGDVVALVKDLRPLFGERVSGVVVHNGSHAHDVTAYLTDARTGAAIAGGLDAR
ncbi:lipase family protein [Streptomyces cellulosae]|uniref:Mucin n=1 Tax=Streptomyces cellulosae TaxID=1968 RepID=A0ABW7YGL4_STRCE